MQHGTQEQRDRLLPRMATGEVRGAFSMSEPGLGSDVAGIRTRAVRQADGGYVIDGQKMWLTNGGFPTPGAPPGRTAGGAGEAQQKPKKVLVEKTAGFCGGGPGIIIPRQS